MGCPGGYEVRAVKTIKRIVALKKEEANEA